MFTLIWFGDRVIHKIVGLAIGVAVLLLFWIGFQLARSNAFRAAQRDIELRTSALPLVNPEFSDHHDFVDGDISAFLESSDLRLLWETKDTLFVFVPVNTAQPQVFVRVVALDRSKILASLRSERIK